MVGVLDEIEQQPDRQLGDFADVQRHRGQRRANVLRELDIGNPGDRDVLRHANPAVGQRLHGTKSQQIVGTEQRSEVAAPGDQFDRGVVPAHDGILDIADVLVGKADAGRGENVLEALQPFAVITTATAADDDAETAVAKLDQMLGGELPGEFEIDDHLWHVRAVGHAVFFRGDYDRRAPSAQLLNLAHAHTSVQDQHAIGQRPGDLFQIGVADLGLLVGIADHQEEVALSCHTLGYTNKLGIERVGNARQDHGDHRRAPFGERAGHQIRSIAGSGNGFLDLLDRRRLDLAGVAQNIRDRCRRHACQACNFAKRCHVFLCVPAYSKPTMVGIRTRISGYFKKSCYNLLQAENSRSILQKPSDLTA